MFSDCIGDTFIELKSNEEFILEEWDNFKGAKLRDKNNQEREVSCECFLDDFGIVIDESW